MGNKEYSLTVPEWLLMSVEEFKADQYDLDVKFENLRKELVYAFRFFRFYFSRKHNPYAYFEGAVFLEHILAELLRNAKELYLMRGQLIQDEYYVACEELVVKIDKSMVSIEYTVEKLNEMVEGKERTKDDEFRKRMQAECQRMMQWLHKQVRSDYSQKEIQYLMFKHQLHYNTRMNMIRQPGDSFRDHVYAVMNSLVLLSIPLQQTMDSEYYELLFGNTLDYFRSRKVWQKALADWNERIAEEYENRQLITNEEKRNFLLGLKQELQRHERLLLRRFGIPYTHKLGQELYEHLNKPERTTPDRMTNADLRELLAYIAQMQELDAKIKALESQNAPNGSRQKTKAPSELFSSRVKDPNELAACFGTMYHDFFDGRCKGSLSAFCNDATTFSALLFILVEYEGMGSYTFATKCKSAFHDFLKQKAGLPLKKTNKNLRNRLNEMKEFQETLKNVNLNQPLKEAETKKEPYLKDFRTIRGNFHGTDFYQQMKKG